jgi:hypothetical protein
MQTISFPTTGDFLIDTLLAYALADLTAQVDKEADVVWGLGRSPFLIIETRLDIDEEIPKTLRIIRNSPILSDHLRFMLNIGNRPWKVSPTSCTYCIGKKNCGRGRGDCGHTVVPAYPIFYKNVERIKTVTWSENSLTKERSSQLEPLYVGLSPYWSKGIRQWGKEYGAASTYVPPQVQVLAMYGLAKYFVTAFANDEMIQLFFMPPVGRIFDGGHVWRILALIHRFINTVGTTTEYFLRNIPDEAKPLAVLAHSDLPSIRQIADVGLSLILVSYDLVRGSPKNARKYEEYALQEIAWFYTALGNWHWDFRALIEDLVRQARNDNFRNRINDALVRLTRAILGKNPQLANDALLDIKRLNDDGVRLHLLERDAVMHIISILMSGRYAYTEKDQQTCISAQ